MLDRGLRAALRPAGRARGARAACVPEVPRLDLRALPTFTIDPPTARDFDDAISAERLDDGAVRVWVHIADVAAHVRPGSHVDREAFRRATSVYVPGLVEPMLPEALSNRACSLVPDQDRLAVTVEMELSRRAGAAHGVPPLDHPLRQAARAIPRSTRSSRARSAPRSRGRSRSRRRAPPRRRSQAARERGRAGGRVRGAGVRLLARGPRDRARAERADRVAPADRAPDDRRQRGGRHAARDAQAAGAVPRARAARAGAGGAAGRAARVARHPDAAAAGAR